MYKAQDSTTCPKRQRGRAAHSAYLGLLTAHRIWAFLLKRLSECTQPTALSVFSIKWHYLTSKLGTWHTLINNIYGHTLHTDDSRKQL